MTTEPSDRDRREAEAIVNEWCGNRNLEIVNDPVYGLNSSGKEMADRIARALAARSAVPDGHVRLPDGRDAKFPTTKDGVVVEPGMHLFTVDQCGIVEEIRVVHTWEKRDTSSRPLPTYAHEEHCWADRAKAEEAAAAARGGER